MKYNYVCMYKYEVYFFLCTDDCLIKHICKNEVKTSPKTLLTSVV